MKSEKIKDFKVIKGGLDPAARSLYQFVSAFVTDTRLMGVEVLYIHWHRQGLEDTEDLHQFFYFDAEEYGLDNYMTHVGNDTAELTRIEDLLLGGLGGQKVELTQDEAVFLVQDYTRASKLLGVAPAENSRDYAFLMTPKISLSRDSRRILFSKECAPITCDNEAINYFLMRVFARDFMPAAFLCNSPGVKGGADGGFFEAPFNLDIYPEIPAATLCKNTIEIVNGSYMCDSLIEADNRYYVMVSELNCENSMVASFKRHKMFSVSPFEAAMMLSRLEYVTCYDIRTTSDEAADAMPQLAQTAFMTPYEKGRLFMVYNKDNEHVRSRVYRLHDDVFGCYFVSDYGQLLLSSYVLDNIKAMEKDLSISNLGNRVVMAGRFEFKEPVVYEFIQDDIEDFLDFIDFYQE